MRTAKGRVTETSLDDGMMSTAWITCPPTVIPAPGQYVLAWEMEDTCAPLATPLFPGEFSDSGFRAVPLYPDRNTIWRPGTSLRLRGPLGHGFHLPTPLRHLALVLLSETAARLMPLAQSALAQGTDVVLFSDARLSSIASSLEILPLASLSEILSWADFLAFDLPWQHLPDLRALLKTTILPCPAQALILAPMPCGALADCGACAVPAAHHGYKLVCKDGPVFDLNTLEW